MAFNFPSNPTLNQTYTLNNSTWTWDGTAWNITFSAAQAQSNTFSIISVSGQPSIVADTSTDVLTVLAGTNISITTDPTTDTITINSNIDLPNVISVAADDSTQRLVSLGETIKFIGGAGIETSADTEGNITISNTAESTSAFENLAEVDTANLTVDQIYEPAIVMLRVDNVGTSAYTFNSHYTGNNPTIYALAGTTIAFHLSAIPGLPFQIQDPTSLPYNTGLVHVATNGTVSTGASAQNKDSGTLYWRIPEGISGNYRYQCQNQAPMVGAITIKRLSVI